MELKNPNFDNLLPSSWASSTLLGTPAGQNHTYVNLNVDNKDQSDATGASATISLGSRGEGGGFALSNATDANSNNTGAGRALKRPKHTLYLPIPRQIQDANSVQYDSGRDKIPHETHYLSS